MNRTYQRIILYGDHKKYEKLKERLGGVPVTVWFRSKMDEALADKRFEKRITQALKDQK